MWLSLCLPGMESGGRILGQNISVSDVLKSIIIQYHYNHFLKKNVFAFVFKPLSATLLKTWLIAA